MKIKNLLFACLTVFCAAVQAAEPAARFELSSVPQVSQAVSRMGNCIAPRFRDSAAALTVFFSAGAVHYGMDPTRPAEVRFYSFGENPVMRIVGFAVDRGDDPSGRMKFAGLRFLVRRNGKLIVFDTEGVPEPLPSAPPGTGLKPGELIRGTIQADAVRRHFTFREFNTRDASARLILGGVDELLAQLTSAEAVFSADAEGLKLELTAFPRKDSALQRWMRQPLPPKGRIETYPGAQTLTVLRLNPTETLRRYGQLYLEQSGKKQLPPVFAAAASGFAALSSGHRTRQLWSMRLTAGVVPGRAQSVRNEILKRYKETPFRGWYSICSDPVLLCSSDADRLTFFCSSRMDTGNISALTEPKEYAASIPDCPFVCFDLPRPEKPLAQLLFEGNVLRLTLQAPDSWFASCGPLLEKPLFLPEKSPPVR